MSSVSLDYYDFPSSKLLIVNNKELPPPMFVQSTISDTLNDSTLNVIQGLKLTSFHDNIQVMHLSLK